MNNKKFKTAILAALFTAMITVATRFIQFPVLSNGGYIHFGDALIILAASLFARPYAIFAGAVGAGIADLTVAPAWAPWTIIIKALVATCFSCKSDKIVTKRNLLGLVPAAVITMGGYYIAEGLLYGNWITPLVSIGGNAIQAVGSSVIFVLLGVALDKMNFKSKLKVL